MPMYTKPLVYRTQNIDKDPAKSLLTRAGPSIVCVGAIYVDTILSVPHFPAEDEKLRATKRIRRRGGNCGNTLEVIGQLAHRLSFHFDSSMPRLHLLSVLPIKASSNTQFIVTSLKNYRHLSLENCFYRPHHKEAASSYILRDEQNGKRTIVSINELPEMTAREFVHTAPRVMSPTRTWYHFEGRNPEVTQECVDWLRQEFNKGNPAIRISVELEKPERKALLDMIHLADAVFYSKIWATTLGYTSAKAFLKSQIGLTRHDAVLCCTWGSEGATVVQKSPRNSIHDPGDRWESVEAWKSEDPNRPVVDTIGAGDTFIAGMLYALNCRPEWELNKTLAFANELAGRKVIQEGFGGLGEQMKDFETKRHLRGEDERELRHQELVRDQERRWREEGDQRAFTVLAEERREARRRNGEDTSSDLVEPGDEDVSLEDTESDHGRTSVEEWEDISETESDSRGEE